MPIKKKAKKSEKSCQKIDGVNNMPIAWSDYESKS
jgi:hypothetical protein